MCWRVGKGCGEGNGENVGKCVEVWGPNTLLILHISLPSPFPTSPLTFPTPQHIFLLSPHLPSPSQSVAKLPCDEVSVAKLPCGEVTGNQPFYVQCLQCQISSTVSAVTRLPSVLNQFYVQCQISSTGPAVHTVLNQFYIQCLQYQISTTDKDRTLLQTPISVAYYMMKLQPTSWRKN